MTINYDRRKLSVGDKVIAAAEKKLSKLDKFFSDTASAEVKFAEVRGISVVEVTVRDAHMYFRAEDRSGDTVAALDSAVDSIVRQIRKNKTRLEKKLRAGAFERGVSEPSEQDDAGVIRRKRFELKPMTEDEAILQMELLNHKFYLFKNSEQFNRVCVAYSREDGGYGILEAE